jgi:putative hemolysin
MFEILIEILILLLLLLANGVFALAEISVVSARKGRLRTLADEGSARARVALAVAEEPTRFLSTVQVGITLIGILAGAFGGARLSGHLAAVLGGLPLLAPYSQPLALGLVVGIITYLSLIVGELVPKRLGLSHPERNAMLVVGPVNLLARLAAPFVWLLTASTQIVLRLLRHKSPAEAPPSDEEIAHLIRQGTTAGVFHQAESAMVEGVLRLDERPVTELMTRRTKIVWLNVADADEINWRKIVASGHSHFPVFEGTRENVLGMVSVKALWANSAIGLPNRLRDHLTKPLVVPQTIHAVQLLEAFKQSGRHLALVADEYGSIQGLVTVIDVMEAIVGDLPGLDDRRAPDAVQREDGSWLVDGGMGLAELKRRFGLGELPGEADGDFQTLGGFMLDRFGRIPGAGDHFNWAGWRFEVVDMDRHRIDKVLLQTEGASPT